MKETSQITRPVASALLVACVVLSIPKISGRYELSFFSTLQIPLLVFLQFGFFFETFLPPFVLTSVGLFAFALSPALSMLSGLSALLLFLASFLAKSLLFQLANAALAAYEAFLFAFELGKPEIAAALCCTSAIAFGDFMGPTIGLLACFQQDFGGMLGCSSGIIAGFASLALRVVEKKKAQASEIRHMYSYAVQNAFVTVKE